MSVTISEVYNTAFYITKHNNSFQIRLTNYQVNKLGIDTKLAKIIENFLKTKPAEYIRKANDFPNTSFNSKKKLIEKDFDRIKTIISQYNKLA